MAALSASGDGLAYALGAATLALAAWSFIELHPALVVGGTVASAVLLRYLGQSPSLPFDRGRAEVARLLTEPGTGTVAPVHLLLLSVLANGVLMHVRPHSTLALVLLFAAAFAIYARTCDDSLLTAIAAS